MSSTSDSSAGKPLASQSGENRLVGLSEAIIERCKSGDRSAMRHVYEHCSQGVYILMVRMVGRQDADDLTQQVFLQMFRKLDQFKGQSKLETWLHRLAVNEALQNLRKRKRQNASQLTFDPLASDSDQIIRQEESHLLDEAISKLEPELRAVLTLKEQQGLSYREIADAVGIPEGTVGSRLNRARRELREALTKLGWC